MDVVKSIIDCNSFTFALRVIFSFSRIAYDTFLSLFDDDELSWIGDEDEDEDEDEVGIGVGDEDEDEDVDEVGIGAGDEDVDEVGIGAGDEDVDEDVDEVGIGAWAEAWVFCFLLGRNIK